MASDAAIRKHDRFARLGMTEKVIFRPSDGLMTREIDAFVDREGQRDVMSGKVLGIRLTVLNDEKKGISAALCDIGLDKIDVAERVGGERTPRAMQRFLQQDEDYVVIEVL